MIIVQAYKCPHTGQLFEEKAAYDKHMRTLSRQRREDARHKQHVTQVKSEFDLLRRNARSFKDIADWLEARSRFLRDLTFKHQLDFGATKTKEPLLTDVTFTELRLSSRVSNTHAAPQHGITNWWQRANEGPLSYPGAQGRFSYRASSDVALFKVLERFGALHSSFSNGTGEKPITYSGGFYLFGEDWPFIGAPLLFEMDNSIDPELYRRIVRYAFPGIAVDTFYGMHEAGLLPDNQTEFCDYLFQFVADNRPAQDTALLPELT